MYGNLVVPLQQVHPISRGEIIFYAAPGLVGFCLALMNTRFQQWLRFALLDHLVINIFDGNLTNSKHMRNKIAQIPKSWCALWYDFRGCVCHNADHTFLSFLRCDRNCASFFYERKPTQALNGCLYFKIKRIVYLVEVCILLKSENFRSFMFLCK